MPLSMLSPIHPINKPYTIRIGLLNQGYLIRVALQPVLNNHYLPCCSNSLACRESSRDSLDNF